MGRNPTRRIAAEILERDRESFLTAQTLTDFNPRNPAFSTVEVQRNVAALNAAEEAEVLAQRALEVARAKVIAAGVTFHEAMQGIKVEVAAQYGVDSEAMHAVGLKQKSERKRPARRDPSAQ